MTQEIYGITRFCEWDKTLWACDVGWGAVTSNGVESCCDGSAQKNCHNTIRVPLRNLDIEAIKRLRELGDIDNG